MVSVSSDWASLGDLEAINSALGEVARQQTNKLCMDTYGLPT